MRHRRGQRDDDDVYLSDTFIDERARIGEMTGDPGISSRRSSMNTMNAIVSSDPRTIVASAIRSRKSASANVDDHLSRLAPRPTLSGFVVLML